MRVAAVAAVVAVADQQVALAVRLAVEPAVHSQLAVMVWML